MNDVRIRYAATEDKVRIERLLEEAQLPFVDIKEHLDDFLVAECKNVIVGSVGIEIYGEVALLRSLVVAPSFKNCGVGRTLYEGIVAYARLKGVRELFLLTTTASQLFKKLGFQNVVRSELPKSIQGTNEFKNLCPASAVCMAKRIDGAAFHVPRQILRLQKHVPGATKWAVALEKAMFTYFDIAPNSRFEMHKHESEQITYVIEGRLVFEIGDQSVNVGPGDIIAIPSNVPHAAFAGNEHVRAVDAWSPVRKDFIQKK